MAAYFLRRQLQQCQLVLDRWQSLALPHLPADLLRREEQQRRRFADRYRGLALPQIIISSFGILRAPSSDCRT